jgi:hypothetical protein
LVLALVLEQVAALEVLVGVNYSLELRCRKEAVVLGAFELVLVDVLEDSVLSSG